MSKDDEPEETYRLSPNQTLRKIKIDILTYIES